MAQKHYLSLIITEYKKHIHVIKELEKMIKEEQLTEEFILRDIKNKERNLNALILLEDNIKDELNSLLRKLKDFSVYCNDTEADVLAEIISGETDYNKIAKKLNVEYNHVKQVVSKLKREITSQIDIENKDGILNALRKISAIKPLK